MIRLLARGHPAVRATHHKTIELTADTAITAAATCVVGVAAQIPEGRPIAGPVRIELRAGAEHATVRALGNPRWRTEAGAVIRRSGNRLDDTIATDADAVAADLPRALVERAARSDVTVEMTVTPEPADPDASRRVVLAWTPGTPNRRLLAELAAADAVLVEDPDARAELDLLDVRPPRVDADQVASRPAGGDRILVLAARHVPGGRMAELLAGAVGDVTVEVVGLPAALAVAAATPVRSPLLLAGAVGRRSGKDLLRTAPRDQRLVIEATREVLPELLGSAARIRGNRHAVLAAASSPLAERPVRIALDERAQATMPGAPRQPLACCLEPVVAGRPGGAANDTLPLELLGELLGQGVSARTVAHALARLPGWSRRRAYDTVNGIAAGAAPPSRRESE